MSHCSAAPPFSKAAIGDWYFRESLVAIDDWETILAEREAEIAQADRIPVYPVPDDGSPVDWLHPVPQSLKPSSACDNSVRLQVDVDSIVLSDDAADETQQRRVQAGETVRGALHPGGGGKSQWYHQYDRRFDSLLALRPQPAPFGVELTEPWNPRFGENRLSLVFSNTSEAPLKLKFRCRFHERSSSSECKFRPTDVATR